MTRPGVTTWCGLGVVALAAAVLSFEALRMLAILAGTPPVLAWLLPVCIDAAGVVATRMWLAGPYGARSFARVLALGMIALSVSGNAVSHALRAYDVTPPWWAVVAVAGVPPVVLGAVAHLAALATRQQPGDSVTVEPPAVEPVETPAGHYPVGDDPAAPGVPTGGDLVSRARHLVAAGEAEGRRVGRASLARELDVSEHQARTLLRELDGEHQDQLATVGGDHR